ncbi:MAG TPA: nucleoside recognition domain-containing protein [Ignavibacteriaceae bacterium]|nr:nucleoside recognition domain-containing protein [Ignavibacteriaceae bacterium]
MLNYVWIAILFLGIGAAVTTDIINTSSDKYRNNKEFPVEIIYKGEFDKKSPNNAVVNVRKEQFNKFYNEKIDKDLTLPTIVTFNQKNQSKYNVKLEKDSPKIWNDAAAVSGEKNDISGNVIIKEKLNDSTYSGAIVLEEVSFVKMKEITNSALDYAATAVNISLGLIGIMAMWLGVMKVAEEAGLIRIIAKMLTPITKRLFPDVPTDHPAMGSMIMNISANMLGLGNAATPFGLKAMEELDKLNPNKGTATNAMVTFLAINTAGMTLIPASAIAIRSALGSADPALIIGTSLFGSTCATIVGLTAAKLLGGFNYEKGKFGAWVKNHIKGIFFFVAFLAIISLLIISGATSSMKFISADTFKAIIQVFSTIAIPLLIVIFIGYGFLKKVKVYEQFVEGAKEGFNVAIRIIPYLVAMLVAIGVFRTGGAMEWLIWLLTPLTNLIGMPAEALPMALMRPLSGSGSLGIMSEIMKVHGPDSFIGIMVSTFYGSSETTFYVLAVYFGSVNIKNTRHALPVGLLADLAGMLGAVFIVKLLFG